MNKKVFAVPVLLLLLGVLGAGWYYYADSGSSNGRIEGSGTLEAIELNIGSQVAAQVAGVKLREGDRVKKGDELVRLDDRTLRDQVAIAQAGVESAKATLDGAGSNTDRKIAQAQLSQAEANLSIANTHLEHAVIKSAIDGIVLSLPFKEGEMASPGSTLVVVGKVSELDLIIYIDQKELGKVKLGQEAIVKVDAYPDKSFKGKIIDIASEAEFTPQNVQTKEQRSNLVFGVTIRVDNTKGLLKPAMPADVEIK